MYKLLEIPFVSKKKYSQLENSPKNGSKYSFEGKAYYILNSDYKIIYQKGILEGNEFEYRTNDEKMRKTDYYQNLTNKNIIRENFFSSSKINFQVAKGDINLIKIINKLSIEKFKTILKLEGFLTGSNSSGADSNPYASPLIMYYSNKKNSELNGCRFVNAIKRIKLSKWKNSDKAVIKHFYSNWNEVLQLPRIEIEELLEKSSIFKNNFYSINPSPFEEDLKTSINEKFIKSYKNEYMEEDIFSVTKSINKYEDEERAIIKLRNIFKKSLEKESLDLGIQEYTGLTTKAVEAAHIIDVSYLRKCKRFNDIANRNNGLRLSSTNHSLMDKQKAIVFDENGKVIHTNNDSKENVNNLVKKILNEERKKFLKEKILKDHLNLLNKSSNII